MENVTRIVVIDHRTDGSGIVLEAWDVVVELALQDDDRTLKVFVYS